MISTRKFNNAVKSYNELMESLGAEHLTIGNSYSEEKASKSKWTLRDLVSEVQYQLDKYFEEDTEQYRELHAADDNDAVYISIWRAPGYDEAKAKQRREQEKARKQAIADRARENVVALKKYIAKYKKDAEGIRCHSRHCSAWD